MMGTHIAINNDPIYLQRSQTNICGFLGNTAFLMTQLE